MTNSYSPELDEIKIFFSPTKTLQRMDGVYEMVGKKIGLTSLTFQAQRESWASAVFLLGYSQITKREYWLRENPKKNEAPDIFAVTFLPPQPPRQKGVSREVMEIEVCEYDEHVKTDISTHLRTKLNRKAYNSSTFLLCYVHKKSETRLIDVIEGLKEIKTSVREIWLLFHLHNCKKGNFCIVRIYLRDADFTKTNLQYQGNYLNLMEISQKEMIHVSKGLTKDVEFNNLGFVYVPLPRIKKFDTFNLTIA